MTPNKIQTKLTFKNITSTSLWIALAIVSMVHLIYLENESLHNSMQVIRITKCLILPIIIAVFVIRRCNTWKKQYNLIIAALFFAFLGDVLLIEWVNNQWLFLSGLGAFLIGHIFSIIFIFKNSSIKQNKKWWLILLPLAIMPLVIWQISTLQNSIVIPVAIFFYATMLAILLGISLTLIPMRDWKIYLPAVIGSILFISSDMILGLRMFKHVQFPPITVMSTYISAQIFLCIFYLNVTNQQMNK